MSWEAAKAAFLEAQAETIDETIDGLVRLQGMYEPLSERRGEITDMVRSLQEDSDKLRHEAKVMNKRAEREEVIT
jgi:FtsZ-binding cell division protein ZapB